MRGDWQRYQLWDSCPAGSLVAYFKLDADESNVPILIDDLSVTTTADPY
ncbi:MAG: hypothetical protein MI919_32910 [Holophagales bacterium]|nr:hypothetical protein [Holophagales bacterium]